MDFDGGQLDASRSLWFDIDLTVVPSYRIWKPESLAWARGVNWARVNDLIRSDPGAYPAADRAAAIAAGRAAGLRDADIAGLASLFDDPVDAFSRQVSSGGHRITAMREQEVRCALGMCLRQDVSDDVDPAPGMVARKFVYDL